MVQHAFVTPLPIAGNAIAHPRRACATRMTVAPPVPVSPDPRPNDEQTNWKVSTLSMADLEVRARDMPAARVHFEAHLKACPADVNAWLEWARAEDRLDRPAGGAERVLSRAVACATDDERLWTTWARMARNRSGIDAAVTVLEAAKLACPNSVELCMARAAIEAELCGIIAARPLYKEAVQLDVTNAKTYLTWAVREERAGNVGIARKIFEKAAKSVPKKKAVKLYSAFAALEGRVRNLDKARFLYMRASEADPVDKVVWQAWGTLEAKAGNIGRARQLFERGVLVDPAYAPTWQAWGLLEARARNTDRARTLFERGVRADPTESSTWHAWGQLEGRAGNRKKAKELYREGIIAVERHRRAGPLYLSLAGMLADEGETDGARALYETACERRTERPHDKARLLHAWARMEKSLGNVDVARVLYLRALDERPKDVFTLYSLALLEQEEERYREARELLKRGLAAAPGDVKCAMALAVLEWNRFENEGGVERARKMFENWAHRCRNDRSFLRAYSAFEAAKGDKALANRLRSLAERAGR